MLADLAQHAEVRKGALCKEEVLFNPAEVMANLFGNIVGEIEAVGRQFIAGLSLEPLSSIQLKSRRALQ